jgi:peptidoglycan LD-endopeptidase CwlK
MSKALADLLPDVQARATKALADLKARGIPYAVTYTLRTYAEQAALYAQGRQDLLTVNSLRDAAGLPHIGQADNSYVVTQCDGKRISEGGTGRSPHQLGTAIDCVPSDNGSPLWPPTSDPRWVQIAQSFKAQGFQWGGEWKDFPDFPHYQLIS